MTIRIKMSTANNSQIKRISLVPTDANNNPVTLNNDVVVITAPASIANFLNQFQVPANPKDGDEILYNANTNKYEVVTESHDPGTF